MQYVLWHARTTEALLCLVALWLVGIALAFLSLKRSEANSLGIGNYFPRGVFAFTVALPLAGLAMSFVSGLFLGL